MFFNCIIFTDVFQNRTIDNACGNTRFAKKSASKYNIAVLKVPPKTRSGSFNNQRCDDD